MHPTASTPRPRPRRPAYRRKGIVGACLLASVVPATAHAYIDPGMGAAVITGILGMVGAVGYTIRLYLQKAKDLFNKKKGDGE